MKILQFFEYLLKIPRITCVKKYNEQENSMKFFHEKVIVIRLLKSLRYCSLSLEDVTDKGNENIRYFDF